MKNIGIVEGFFGPAWLNESRKTWASFLKDHHGSFYIYAPKRDQYLRKSWREVWPSDYKNFLTDLSLHFKSHQIKFGLGFSPFAIGDELTLEDQDALKEKLDFFNTLNLDYLGLFFDDMPVTKNLLVNQEKIVAFFEKHFHGHIIFCPSFYSYDPILDKVFGQRPDGYVEGLKSAFSKNIDICWTGPKVISDEISDSHLLEVNQLLGRKPFVWENLYANDGPRNCKFLKLKYFEGREDFLDFINGVSFNLMNQSELSKLVYLSSVNVLVHQMPTVAAFEEAAIALTGPELATLILTHREEFLSLGYDQITDERKLELAELYGKYEHPLAKEIVSFLRGEYIVGPECLTD